MNSSSVLACPVCLKPMYWLQDKGQWSTLVAYFSEPGHNHDDNCVTRVYGCADGHQLAVSKINRCSKPGCDWQGIDHCFCHPGMKLTEWPEER